MNGYPIIFVLFTSKVDSVTKKSYQPPIAIPLMRLFDNQSRFSLHDLF